MTHLLQLLRITSINETGPNGKVEEVQSSSPIDLGGGNIAKEAMDE
jgi:hypothetical protein